MFSAEQDIAVCNSRNATAVRLWEFFKETLTKNSVRVSVEWLYTTSSSHGNPYTVVGMEL